MFVYKVELCDFSFVYIGGYLVLKGLLFIIYFGELVVIIGYSGNGKLMFVKCLMGLYEVISG